MNQNSFAEMHLLTNSFWIQPGWMLDSLLYFMRCACQAFGINHKYIEMGL